ncbi:MAG: chemotaxis protein CheA [Oscillospiraceae bacterium]|nr:chemotaxis protein CheA [Oscillospiraceae bacterium]
MSADDSMLDTYIYENQQLLENLDDILLSGEEAKSLTPDQINEVFRVMHTIKGASSMMEFEDIAKLAHAVEDVFAQIREFGAKSEEWPSVFDMVFRAVSFFNGEMAKIQESGKPDGTDEALISELHAQLAKMKASQSGEPTASAQEETPKPAAVAVAAKTKIDPTIPYYKVKVLFEENAQMEAVRSLGVEEDLKGICVSRASVPADLEEQGADKYIVENGFTLYVQSRENPDEFTNILNHTMFCKKFSVLPIDGMDEEIPESIRIPAEPAAETAKAESAPYGGAAAGASGSCPSAADAGGEKKAMSAASEGLAKQNFISVNVNKLDSLLDMVGEIVTAQSMVISNADFGSERHDNFDAAAKQLHDLINELQDIVMSIRMLPISTVFQKMRRIVRDMSKKFDKDIELVLVGEETEVDKNVIDSLSDPLMHIIRNSVDHGIESREARVAAGKPAKGRVTLEAHTTGSDVIVTISDDGAGLNRDKILAKAREKGLVTKPDSEITDKEVYNMIFLPGFSTKEKVTEYSGRGVGMDVVRRNINQIGGSLSIESIPGKGLIQTIRIPLTLTIVDGMKFEVGNISFIVPTAAVETAIQPEPGDVFVDPEGNEMIMLLGQCYSVVRISKLFNIETEVEKPEDGMMMHLRSEENNFCILFDHLDGEYQVVAKTLPDYLEKCTNRMKGISGCAVLGDGSINLILDVNNLTDDEGE